MTSIVSTIMRPITMVRTSGLLALSLALAVAPASAQKSAHDAEMRSVVTDGRGQVFATRVGKDVRIWSLTDGALLYHGDADTPEWLGKVARYRLRDDLEGNYHVMTASRGTVNETYSVRVDGKPDGAYPSLPTGTVDRHTSNRATGTVLFSGWKNGKVFLYLYKPVAGERVDVKLWSSVDHGDKFIYPRFSPTGAYIVDAGSRRIWNVSTGKSHRISDDVPLWEGWLPPAYTPDETRLSVVTKRDDVAVLELSTGKVVATYTVPAELRALGATELFALSDGESYLVKLKAADDGSDAQDPKYRRVWLVRAGKTVSELDGTMPPSGGD